MTTRPEAEHEVLILVRGPGRDPPSGKPLHLCGVSRERRVEAGDVDLVPAQRPERIGLVENVEAVDDAVEGGGVPPPVVWVPDEGQLTAALEPAGEEGAVTDQPAGLRILDAVTPYLRDVLAGQRVPGQHLV